MPQRTMVEEIQANDPKRKLAISKAARLASELIDYLIEHNIGPGEFEHRTKAGELHWTGDRYKR